MFMYILRIFFLLLFWLINSQPLNIYPVTNKLTVEIVILIYFSFTEN